MPDPEPDVESAHPGTPTDLRQWMVSYIVTPCSMRLRIVVCRCLMCQSVRILLTRTIAATNVPRSLRLKSGRD